jgi:beta-glucanase (GH16 family)
MPVGNITGWRRVFADGFRGRVLDRSKWRVYDGQPGGDPAGWFDPSHVKVANGDLVISAYRAAADGGKWATGGVSSSPGLVQRYGKYLVRLRFGMGEGIGHALVLATADGTWPPEIDFSEDNGSGRNSTLATLHYGSDHTRIARATAVDLTQWHTLGVEWTPRRLRYTLDGRTWLTMSTSGVPSVPMVLDIQTQAWPCAGTWGRCPDASTPPVVRLYVDWAVAYAPAGLAAPEPNAVATVR